MTIISTYLRRITPLLIGLATVVGVAAGTSSPAVAQTLLISVNFNGGGSIQACLDQAGCDTNATLGVVVFQPTFANWVVDIDVGTSKPIIGSANLAQMNLSILATSTGAGTLQVTLTDTGFTSPIGNLNAISTVGGAWAAPVTYSSSLTDINGTQALTNAAFAFLPPGSTQGGSAIGVVSPYSLQVIATLTSAAAGTNGSVDTRLEVPEPGTLGLMGFGLLLLGYINMRRRPKYFA